MSAPPYHTPKHSFGNLIAGPLTKAILIGLTLITAALIYYNYARERSITVSVLSEYMLLESTNKAVWQFGEALICIRKQGRRSRVPAQLTKSERRAIRRGEKCGELEIEKRGPLVINLQPQITVSIRQFGSGTMQLKILSKKGIAQRDADLEGVDTHLPTLSRVLVARAEMISLGVLQFDGLVRLGREVKNGESSILRSGSYEMREELPFRSNPIVVSKGTFVRGDKVQFVGENGKEKISSGFITMPQSDKRGFQVVATFKAENAAIKLQKAGFIPTMLTPKWTERALADPFTVAVAALLGMFAALVTLLNELVSLLSTDWEFHHPATTKDIEQDQDLGESQEAKMSVDDGQSEYGETTRIDNEAT